MISPETEIDVLADISRNLDRVATALESIVNACVRGEVSESGRLNSHIELFTTNHEL